MRVRLIWSAGGAPKSFEMIPETEDDRICLEELSPTLLYGVTQTRGDFVVTGVSLASEGRVTEFSFIKK